MGATRWRSIIIGSTALGLLIIGFIVSRVGLLRILRTLEGASPVFIVCYLVVSLLIAAVLAFKWKVILHAHGVDLPWRRLFVYHRIGYAVGYVTPSAHVGGEPVRAYLLHREDVDTNTAFSAVIIDKSVELSTDIAFFFFGALVILNSVAVGEATKAFLIVFSLALILGMGVFIGGILGKRSMFVAIFRLLRLHKSERLRPIESNLAEIERKIARFYRERKEYFLIILVLMAILWMLMFLEYRFALLIFGQLATPAQIFPILTSVGIAYALPIPAAIGTLELGQISAAGVLGISGATAVALSFLIRTRDLVWTGFGLAFLSVHQFSFKRLSKESSKLNKDFIVGKSGMKTTKRMKTAKMKAETTKKTRGR